MVGYFDSSALVKLLVAERGSVLAEEFWIGCSKRATSLVSYVEVRAAIARAVRSGRIRGSKQEVLIGVFDDLWDSMSLIRIDENLVHVAAGLTERHALRGYDAVHLASAIEVDSTADHFLLSSWGTELAEAAYAEGISTVRE